MKPQFLEDRVAEHVGPAEKALTTLSQATVGRSGSWVKRVLHGTILGHPLHSAMVAVPIGAYTTAVTLDALDLMQGTEKHAESAKSAVELGMASTALAAASGLADWSATEGTARKVGVVHALFNTGATLAMLGSLMLRDKKEQRVAAAGLGMLGYGLLMVGGYLGGHLAYKHRVGMDHAQRTGPQKFAPIFPATELPENEPHKAEVLGTEIYVVKQHGVIYALGDRDAHSGASLADGQLLEGAVRSPRGTVYSLRDGSVLDGPSAYAQPVYEARIYRGQVELRLASKN